MKFRYLTAIIGTIVLFAIGLVFFFIFSAPYGDGLEKTMEISGVEGHEQIYSAPLDYGENYTTALIMGIIGFFAVLVVTYGLSKAIKLKG